MSSYYFSRARLSDEATIKALYPLLKSDGSSHSLIWSLFAGDANQKRDFLYREAEDGWFYILSSRKPYNPNNIFHIDEPKEYTPNLKEGDRLQFSLRANPVVRRRIKGTRKSKKSDIVMDALHQLDDKSQRANKRHDFIWQKGEEWLRNQGAKNGFALEPASAEMLKEPALTEEFKNPKIMGYRQNRIYQNGKKSPLSFSSLDFEGVLNVTDPLKFERTLHNGLGAARGFGCGLMMIRRA